MKSLALVFGILVSIHAWADSPKPVTEIDCSDGNQKIIKIERMTRPDGDTSFQASYFFKKLEGGFYCLADAANVPEAIRCESSYEGDPSTLVLISSVDGILNVGEMTINGQKTRLYCHANWP